MKNQLLFIAFLCSILLYPASCKKFINQQKEDALVSFITNGTWRVTRYMDHQTDITDSFAAYAFEFNSNGTVEAITAGQITTGTWVGDIAARTIQSDFPNAGDPLKKLNYTWQITDSYTDSVSARTAVDSSYNYLEMHKN